MEATMKQLIISLLVLGVVVLAGCNTVEGVGKDIKKAGESIEKSAK
jgi:predicted small secreted protein